MKQKSEMSYKGYHEQLCYRAKCIFKILKYVTPWTILWILYYSQSTIWLFEALKINGDVFNYALQLHQSIRPLFLVTFVPCSYLFIYPKLDEYATKKSKIALIAFFVVLSCCIISYNLINTSSKDLSKIKIPDNLDLIGSFIDEDHKAVLDELHKWFNYFKFYNCNDNLKYHEDDGICSLYGNSSTSCSGISETLCISNFLVKLIEADANVPQVRTVEERNQRWMESAVLDFIGLVEQHGYTAEEYDVTTEDKYILKLHRISGSPKSPPAPGKPVVYMHHCLFCSSDSYVAFGPKKSLAMQLADEGYDIWLGNVRGNTYSKRHVKYSTDRDNWKFWNFSMDEMGLIDLPAFIDTVLRMTGQKKIAYMGFSMGTTLSFMLLSSRPKYNDIINVNIAMASVSSFTPPFSLLIQMILKYSQPIMEYAESQRIYEVMPRTRFGQFLSKTLCTNFIGRRFCSLLLKMFMDTNNLDYTEIPNEASHYPSGTSLKALRHQIQIIAGRELRKYRPRRGQETKKCRRRAKYDLTKITAPVAIFYGDKDLFVNVKDVFKLRDRLPNVIAFEQCPKGYNHLDFLMANNIREAVHEKAVTLINDAFKRE